MITWKIEKRKIDDLKGFKKNPRKFTEKGLKDLKKSLEKLGDANLITINADNTILGGHARIQVMKELGYKEVDVKVPTKMLNEKQCEEVVIRLNADNAGEWDLEKLQSEFNIEELDDWGLPLDFEKDMFNTQPQMPYNSGTDTTTFENLPPELQNTTLSPEDLEKITNDFPTAKERVIIVYTRENRPVIEKLLGVDLLGGKILFDEKELQHGKLQLTPLE